MPTKFAEVSLSSSESGAIVTGEFVAQSSTAYMVAVKGKVRSYMKSEWTPIAPAGTTDFGLFSDLLGGRL